MSFARKSPRPISQEMQDRLAAAQAKSTSRFISWLSKRDPNSPFRSKKAKTVRRDLSQGGSLPESPPSSGNPPDVPMQEITVSGDARGVTPANPGLLPPVDRELLPIQDPVPPPTRDEPLPQPALDIENVDHLSARTSPLPREASPLPEGQEHSPRRGRGSSIPIDLTATPTPARMPSRPGKRKSLHPTARLFTGQPSSSRPYRHHEPVPGFREASPMVSYQEERMISPPPSPSELSDFLGDLSDPQVLKERVTELFGKLIYSQRDLAGQIDGQRMDATQELKTLRREHARLLGEVERLGGGGGELSPSWHIARARDQLHLVGQELTAMSAYYYPREPPRTGMRGRGRWKWIQY